MLILSKGNYMQKDYNDKKNRKKFIDYIIAECFIHEKSIVS